MTCQFEVPQSLGFTSYRLVLADRFGEPDSYFDDIQIDQNYAGDTCTGVTIEPKGSQGSSGYYDAVVDDLALLLTSGRLSSNSRKIISSTIEETGGSALDGLKMAQQMVLTAPEFHSTNVVKSTEQLRETFSFPQPTGDPYKAGVYVMLAGGCDSFNMIAPYLCTKGKDLYSEYVAARQYVALPRNMLLPIDVSGQICQQFGIHSDIPIIKDLYEEGDLMFFANMGTLTEPVDKSDWLQKTKTQLFAHNTMQYEVRSNWRLVHTYILSS